MKQKQVAYLVVLFSPTAVFYHYFWYLYSATCKKHVHIVEKNVPAAVFLPYSLALCVLIRIYFCEYGPLGQAPSLLCMEQASV